MKTTPPPHRDHGHRQPPSHSGRRSDPGDSTVGKKGDAKIESRCTVLVKPPFRFRAAAAI
jgi:hypothetical protein